jgi:hypothetical protein
MKYLILVFALGVCFAQTKGEKVKQKVSETVDATKDFSQEKKDQFISKVRGEMAEVDQQIHSLGERAQTATGDAKAKITEQVNQLEVKRKDLKLRLEELSHSSGKAWNQMKLGFENAWNELKVSIKKATHELR